MTESIMIVDDDPDLRDTLRAYIELHGYDTLAAANGREALDLLGSLPVDQRPCLILLDLMMPVMDGYAFRAEQQKLARASDIPVVVITAGANVRNDELEAAAVIHKPLNMGRLMSAVRQHC